MIHSQAPNRKERRRRQQQKRAFENRLNRYRDALLAKGTEEREVARAVFYVAQYGFDAMEKDPGGPVVFDEPNCETGWDCLNPEHQRFKR